MKSSEKKLRVFIKEILINEIGGSGPVYKFKRVGYQTYQPMQFTTPEGKQVEYEFYSDAGHKYSVLIWGAGYHEIEFVFDDGEFSDKSGANDVYKVMRTVVECVKDFHNEHPFAYKYSWGAGGEDSKTRRQQKQLYKRIAQERFRGSNVIVGDNSIKFPEREKYFMDNKKVEF